MQHFLQNVNMSSRPHLMPPRLKPRRNSARSVSE
jgi:hypothetical protein